ncbi:hypothetical protein M9H77_08054 [Catharanthus roseus]|uniref:Uncharacterized protein n=1 Tax=Catharanthus roseus TaxID=4058 RepID=A0ACC0BWN0_CATRO|nr:hypothetical protein M9H77_08054 [Catharanthus roseus]
MKNLVASVLGGPLVQRAFFKVCNSIIKFMGTFLGGTLFQRVFWKKPQQEAPQGTFKLKSSGHKFLNTSQESKSINYLFPFPQLVTKPTLKDQNNPHASSGKTSESHNQAKFKLIEERQSQELIVEKRRSNRLKTRNLK